MRMLLHVLFYEWKNLWRTNTLKVLMVVVFGAGVYGIFFGKFEIDRQKDRIIEVKNFERQKFDSLLVWARLDTSIASNKERYEQAVSPNGVGWAVHFAYAVPNDPAPTSGLCLGQRDLYPAYYRITMTDLARQMNVGELANPMKLLTGNFDLSYVIVFLFPLLVVALFYDLYAKEKEEGTLALLKSQPTSIAKLFVSKAILRLLLVWGFLVVLLLLGFLIQGIALTDHLGLFIQWVSVAFGYTLIWMVLMSLIVAIRMGSALSAIMGLGVWLLFTLVAPAILNLFLLANEPLPNRAELVHEVRELNDRMWEEPRSFVLDKFYPNHPMFSEDTTDFNKWYYAGFTLIDEEANAIKADFEQQVAKRNALLERWAWLAPAAMVHEQLSSLSNTDRSSHMEFVEEVHAYHTELKKLYYARIFNQENFSVADLEELSSKL